METLKISLKNSWILFVLLLFSSIGLTFLMAKTSYVIGIVFLVLILGGPILYLILADIKVGYLIFTYYSFFLFLISRVSPIPLPTGILIDLLIGVLFCSIFLLPIDIRKKNWKSIRNPVSLMVLSLLLYDLIQALNPNAHKIVAWMDGMRETVYLVVIYLVAFHVFDTYRFIKKYSESWIFLIFIAALWSIRQEITGFWAHEWAHIYRQPEMYSLIYQWGHFRKFSFLSDVANCGMTMAFGALYCMVMLLSKNPIKIRILYFIAMVAMLLAMNYSGTRTATAMVVAGIVFYGLLTMNNWKTLVIGILGVVILGAIIFGPFYGSRIQRLRSTFFPSEDASMGVRDYNRVRIQPYIWSHPIGGGVNTADANGVKYSPGHRLAGFITDSGYVTVAVERGYIGLILVLILFGGVLIIGVINYHRARSAQIRAYYAAYMTSFFSLTIANFTQSSIDQKPLYMIFISIMVIIVNLIKHDQFCFRKERAGEFSNTND